MHLQFQTGVSLHILSEEKLKETSDFLGKQGLLKPNLFFDRDFGILQYDPTCSQYIPYENSLDLANTVLDLLLAPTSEKPIKKPKLLDISNPHTQELEKEIESLQDQIKSLNENIDQLKSQQIVPSHSDESMNSPTIEKLEAQNAKMWEKILERLDALQHSTSLPPSFPLTIAQLPPIQIEGLEQLTQRIGSLEQSIHASQSDEEQRLTAYFESILKNLQDDQAKLIEELRNKESLIEELGTSSQDLRDLAEERAFEIQILRERLVQNEDMQVRIQELTTNFNSYDESIRDYQTALATKELEISELQNQLQQLDQAFTGKDNLIAELSSLIEIFQNDAHDDFLERTQLKKLIEKLQTELEKSQTRETITESEKDQIQRQSTKFIKEIQRRYQEALDDLQQQKAHYEELHTDYANLAKRKEEAADLLLQAREQEHAKNIASLTEQLTQERQRLREAQIEFDKGIDILTTLQAETLKEKVETLFELNQIKSESKKKITKLQKELEKTEKEHQEELEALQATYQEAQDALAQALTDSSTKEDQLKALQQSFDEAQDNLRLTQDRHQEKLQSLQHKHKMTLQTLKQEHAQELSEQQSQLYWEKVVPLRLTLEDSFQTIKALKQERSIALETSIAKQDAIESLTKDIKKLEHQISILTHAKEKERSESDTDISELQSEITKLETQLFQALQEKRTINLAIHSLETALLETQTVFESMEESLKTFKKDYDQLQIDHAISLDEKENITSELEAVQEKLAQALTDASTKDDQLKELQQALNKALTLYQEELADVYSQRKAKDSSITKLESDIQRLSEEKADLLNHNLELQKHLESAIGELESLSEDLERNLSDLDGFPEAIERPSILSLIEEKQEVIELKAQLSELEQQRDELIKQKETADPEDLRSLSDRIFFIRSDINHAKLDLSATKSQFFDQIYQERLAELNKQLSEEELQHRRMILASIRDQREELSKRDTDFCSYANQLRKLTEDLKSKDLEFETSLQEKDRLESEIAQQNLKIHETEQRIAELTEENTRLEAEIDYIKEIFSDHYNPLAQENEKLEEEIAQLTEKLQKSTQEQEILREEIDGARIEIKELQTAAEVAERYEEQIDEIAQLSKQIDKLEAYLQALLSENESLINQLDRKTISIQYLHKEKQKAELALSQLTEDHEKTTANLHETTLKLRISESQLRQTQKQLLEAKKEIETLHHQEERLQQAINTLTDDLNSLQASSEETTSEQQERIIQLTSKLQELIAKNGALQEQIIKQEQQIADFQSKHREITQENLKLSLRVSKLEAKKAELEDRIEDLKAMIEEKNQKIAELETRILKLENQILQSNQLIASLEKDVISKEQTIDNQKSIISDLEKEKDTSELTIITLQARLKKLEESLSEKEAELEQSIIAQMVSDLVNKITTDALEEIHQTEMEQRRRMEISSQKAEEDDEIGGPEATSKENTLAEKEMRDLRSFSDLLERIIEQLQNKERFVRKHYEVTSPYNYQHFLNFIRECDSWIQETFDQSKTKEIFEIEKNPNRTDRKKIYIKQGKAILDLEAILENQIQDRSIEDSRVLELIYNFLTYGIKKRDSVGIGATSKYVLNNLRKIHRKKLRNHQADIESESFFEDFLTLLFIAHYIRSFPDSFETDQTVARVFTIGGIRYSSIELNRKMKELWDAISNLIIDELAPAFEEYLISSIPEEERIPTPEPLPSPAEETPPPSRLEILRERQRQLIQAGR